MVRAKEGTYCIDSSRVLYIEMLNHHTIFHTQAAGTTPPAA